MSKLGKTALNKKVKPKKQKFKLPRGKHQWEIVEYLYKNPGWSPSLHKKLIKNEEILFLPIGIFSWHPQIDKLIEKNMIEEKSVVRRYSI
jgi:hypothetical protein|tara:strand:+ start:112 stop:381 length:270 start_codon:yes stop_codon:yes gene_type:complete